MRRWAPLAVLSVLAGCGGDVALFVDVKTDLVPGAEFIIARASLDGEMLAEIPAALGDPYLDGVRVAETDTVTPGDHELLVELLRTDRTLLSERRFLLGLDGSLVLTALLTRDCRGVSCAASETCVAGACVSAACVEIDDDACAPPECTADADCPMASGACAVARCDQGACLYAGSCAAGQYCSPEEDCQPVPGGDLPPLASFSAAAFVGGAEGEIAIQIEPPVDPGNAVEVEVRRVAGDAAPADCEDGDVVGTVIDLTMPASLIDRIVDRWVRTHSYRACVRDGDGAAYTDETMTALAVRYANPGPGCQQPPCTNPASTATASDVPALFGGALTATGSSGGDITLGDFDNDDVLDVAVGTNAANAVHLGNGDGSFGAATALGGVTTTMATTVGDFDNDGNLDVVFANRDTPSVILLGDGAGGFGAATPVDPGSFPAVFDVEAADLDGDQDLDLIITQFAGRDRVYLGAGDGTFTYLRDLEQGDFESCVNCLQIRDVNRDLVPDVVLGYNNGVDRLHVFRGNGDATFQSPISIGYGTLRPISVRLADLNGDGPLDVVVGRSLGGDIYTGIGDGDGGFTPLTALSTTTSSRCYGLFVADFDGDGDADIVFSQDSAGVIGYLEGDGDGSFAPQVDLDGGATYTTTSIDAGDLDDDGLLDFVVGADAGSLVFLGR